MKIIEVKNVGISRYTDNSDYPVGDLVIQFKHVPDWNGEFRFVGYMNGAKIVEKTVTPNSNVVEIPADSLAGGEFAAQIIYFVRGVKTKVFEIENLIITEINDEYKVDQQILEIEKKVSNLETLTKATTEQVVAVNADSNKKLQTIADLFLQFLNVYIENNPFSGAEELQIIEKLKSEVKTDEN